MVKVKRSGGLRPVGGTIVKTLCLAMLAGVAGCSDDYARMGGGITTASLGLEPSNQDRIIRKASAGDKRAGLAPAGAPEQAYPGDTELTPSEPAADTSSSDDGYSAPTVEATSLAPVAAAADDATTPKRRGLTPKPSSQGEPLSKVVYAAPAAVRTAVAPKLAVAGVPVIPAAPTEPATLRSVGELLVVGSVRNAVSNAEKTAKRTVGVGESYTVVSGDSLYAIARRHGISTDELRAANGVTGSALALGQSLVIPVSTKASAPAPVKTAVREKVRETPDTKVAVPIAKTAEVVTGSVASAVSPKSAAAITKDITASKPFAWPARGRILAGFGQRTTKGTNDGIDIALPVGTKVSAVADGVVVYSGTELEDFGHLVLVRHDDGWVSAYANGSANLVKRGDRVKKGQPIAKSGKSGNASEPQLHFELRRNSKPVDPSRHLAG